MSQCIMCPTPVLLTTVRKQAQRTVLKVIELQHQAISDNNVTKPDTSLFLFLKSRHNLLWYQLNLFECLNLHTLCSQLAFSLSTKHLLDDAPRRTLWLTSHHGNCCFALRDDSSATTVFSFYLFFLNRLVTATFQGWLIHLFSLQPIN